MRCNFTMSRSLRFFLTLIHIACIPWKGKNLNSTSALVNFIMSVKGFLTFHPVIDCMNFLFAHTAFLLSSFRVKEKQIFYLHNSVHLTYLSLKWAKFGLINDLMHFWLNNQSHFKSSRSSRAADRKSEGSGHGKSYFEWIELLWKNSLHFSLHIKLKDTKYHLYLKKINTKQLRFSFW